MVKMLDMELAHCRFTFRRGIPLPLRIEGRRHQGPPDGKVGSRLVCLSDVEGRLLLKFLDDYYMSGGVPDGG